MRIIQLTANIDGSRQPIALGHRGPIPHGFAAITPGTGASAMQTHQGFVDLTIEGGMVTAITGNDAAYQAYLDSLPKPEPPTMTTEEAMMDAIADLTYRMDLQTLGLTEVTQ